jgi:hypothetical protein
MEAQRSPGKLPAVPGVRARPTRAMRGEGLDNLGPTALGSCAVDKKALSERDVCTEFITPALGAAGWELQSQVRENVHLTKGRVIVRGKLVNRGTANFADYVLYARPNANVPLGILEAKDNNHGVGDGMQQALGYADMLDVPFVYSSNGDGFLLHDRTGQALLWSAISIRTSFLHPKSCGSATALGRGSPPPPKPSSPRTTTRTVAARPLATTRSTPSTASSRRWRRGRAPSDWRRFAGSWRESGEMLARLRQG